MSIEFVTISRVSVTDKKKDGSILKNKYGEFFRVGLQVEEKLDSSGNPVWINGFLKHKPDWKIGEKIQLELTSSEYEGKTQLQFRLPKKESVQEDKIKALEQEVALLKGTKPEEDVSDKF